MKKTVLFAIFLSAGLLSCEDCDDSPATVNPNQDIIATFKLTGFIIPEAVDMDQNGQSSSNLIHDPIATIRRFSRSIQTARIGFAITSLSSPIPKPIAIREPRPATGRATET